VSCTTHAVELLYIFSICVSISVAHACAVAGTDGWDQQLLGGANGYGNLVYPGRPDKIGGTTHIPVTSLRLLMIREGQEDFEWLTAAARVIGRDRVVDAMAPVMVTSSNFTSDPDSIWGTRAKLARLIVASNGVED
jgi:hypothetical protein